MLNILRYLLIGILITFISFSSVGFAAVKQASPFTEQNEKIESETSIDEAIPHSRFKKQISKQYNPFLRLESNNQNTTSTFINKHHRPGEQYLFLKLRKLLI